MEELLEYDGPLWLSGGVHLYYSLRISGLFTCRYRLVGLLYWAIFFDRLGRFNQRGLETGMRSSKGQLAKQKIAAVTLTTSAEDEVRSLIKVL